MANDISKNTSGQPDSEHDQYDLEKELRAMDDFIERLKVRRMALGQLNRSLVPSRSFLDELIDVNCTPLGQNIENHYPGAWYSLFDVWQLVGSYLSEAMSYEQKR